MAPHKISRLGIGRLFQGRQLIDNLSLMENMKIASVNRDGENPLTAFSDKDNTGEQNGKRKSKQLKFWNRYLERITNIWRCLTIKPRNYLMGNSGSLP